MLYHSAVSLDYLEELLAKGVNLLRDEDGGPAKHAVSTILVWRSAGYYWAPPCDKVLPNGHCAGHQE